MKQYFAYIRVSTQKQGEYGSSLGQQRAAIEGHAQRHGLSIIEWIEERETAAKRGRSGFTAMLAQLRAGLVHGVIIHKIDRSARNLKDWADLGELIDHGIEVHFANESLDLQSRGGRLSADIQAVVAADYIRNLRDEVRKGFYGRLKQGVLPLPAPVGYCDEGRGNPKSIDPVMGPLVRQAFELYATGGFTLATLVAELERRGLRNRVGKPLNLNMVSRLLNNPFYIGVIHIRRTNERFEGKHKALIQKSLFDRVQARLAGKVRHKGLKHEVLYRRAFHCARCNRVLIPERQKGHTYYRCHEQACKGTSLREEVLTESIENALSVVRMTPSELLVLEAHIIARDASSADEHAEELKATTLRLAQLEERDRRLVDARIDGVLDRASYETRKKTLLDEKLSVRERLAYIEAGKGRKSDQLRQKLELLQMASDQGESAKVLDKLYFLRRMTSNLRVAGKSVVIAWDLAFQMLANRVREDYGPPYRDASRTGRMHELTLRFMDVDIAWEESSRDTRMSPEQTLPRHEVQLTNNSSTVN